MTARATQAQLIQELRDITNASGTLWTNGTATYWDDAHLGQVLDMYRVDFERVLMQPNPSPAAGGSLSWFNYYLPHKMLESASGTTIFTVFDATGSAIAGTAFTVDYRRGQVAFTTNTGGSTYFASGRSYDVYGAAGEVLERWAAHEMLSFDFSADGQSFRRSQKIENLKAMAVDCRGKAWPQKISTVRSDLVGQGAINPRDPDAE